MFQWLFREDTTGGVREQNAKKLYNLLCSKEVARFKRMWSIYQSHGPNSVLWDFTDSNKRTLLHVAVMVGDVDVLKLLKKVPADAQDDQGYTALHYAVMINKSYDLINWLMFRIEMDVNIQSNQGYTAYDVVEGYWQAECNRLSKQRKINKDFFTKVFLEKVGVLFDKDTSDRKARDFLKEYPAIKKFLQQHSTLSEIAIKKQSMEQKQCQRKNEIDFKTFSEPHFLSFDWLAREEKYWYNMPQILFYPKASNLPNQEDLASEKKSMRKEETVKEAPVFELSKLYEKLETIAANNAMAEQTNSIDTRSAIALQQTPKEEPDVITQNAAFDSFSASKTQALV